MKRLFTPFFCVLTVGFITACLPESPCGSPPPTPSVRFYVTSQTDIPLVRKQDSRYAPDSVQLLRDGRAINLSYRFDEALQSYLFDTGSYPDTPSGTDMRLLLYLDRNDTDTLDLTYRIEKTECGTIVDPNTFFFNQTRVFPASGTYVLKLMKK